MSKKRKKQRPRRPPQVIPGVKVTGLCDDCNSEAVMIEHPVGTELRILHDETCPAYRVRQAEREKEEQ